MSDAPRLTLGIVARPRLRRPLSARAARRGGMSILEVMLATTMVLGCVMALSRVAFIAGKHATSAEDRSLAQIHCQNIMEELLAGIRPLREVSSKTFEGGAWIYMVEVETLDQAGLTRVAVTVDRVDEDETSVPSTRELEGYRLVRWVRTGQRAQEMLEGESGETFDEEGMSDEMSGGAMDEQPPPETGMP